jgi:hypothetical protein
MVEDRKEETPTALELNLPAKRSREIEDTEWFESGTAEKTVTKQVKTADSFFCRLCGKMMERETLTKHLASHSRDLYQTRPEDTAKVTLSRTPSLPPIKPTGTCINCGLDSSVIDKIKRALRLLSEGYNSDIVV